MERLYGAAVRPIEVLGMTHECAACNRYFRVADVETVDDGTGTIGYACEDCITAHDGLGKFEGNGNDLAAAIVLYAWSMDSGEDDFMSSESWGYCGRFGKWLLFEDERGFVYAQEYPTVEAAVKEFDSLHDDGWGYQEDDYSISFERGHWYAYDGGKEIGRYERRSRALAAVSLEARRSGYYGSCWEDYGNSIRSVRYW